MDLDKEEVRQSILCDGYNVKIEDIRNVEYPQLQSMSMSGCGNCTSDKAVLDCTYLDHAGATLYSTSAIKSFSADLCANLYGNPHSQSPSSQASERRIASLRTRVLHFLGVNTDDYDVVFCANATAGMKIVMEALSAVPSGFKYRYHGDGHTSLIGIRELSFDSKCISSDADVNEWLLTHSSDETMGLFGWPAQSNFSGRRLPNNWSRSLRKCRPNYCSLLDAAALVTTAPLDLGCGEEGPDFTVLSFYKIFGFPDLGALIVRKKSGHILHRRKYFGGGTVDSLTTEGGFYARKSIDEPHDHLEDGTIPFHSIIALDSAIDAYERIHGSQKLVSFHACSISRFTHSILSKMKHENGQFLCVIYGDGDFSCASKQGPVISFNMRNPDGSWIGYHEVEKLASLKKIHIRAGGLCNPGGVQKYVGMQSWEIRAAYAAGHKCSDEMDVMHGKPTGALRVSFGAMSTIDDALSFLKFISEFYLDQANVESKVGKNLCRTRAKVDNLIIYPIKSCGGFKIPPTRAWEIRPHGLAWDREWCLVHNGTGRALSQKAYPKMVFIRPIVDLEKSILQINIHKSPELGRIEIPLAEPPQPFCSLAAYPSRVCGEKLTTYIYNSPEVVNFFSAAVGIPCTLARFPESLTYRNISRRLYGSKLTLKDPSEENIRLDQYILLSNESPLLVISKQSLELLNSQIRLHGGKIASADVFRANIVIDGGDDGLYAEDYWKELTIGSQRFEILGSCRRCHMICIDQETAEKNEEPFVTLSKQRRFDGKVIFGQHAAHIPSPIYRGVPMISAGEAVTIMGYQDL